MPLSLGCSETARRGASSRDSSCSVPLQGRAAGGGPAGVRGPPGEGPQARRDGPDGDAPLQGGGDAISPGRDAGGKGWAKEQEVWGGEREDMKLEEEEELT